MYLNSKLFSIVCFLVFMTALFFKALVASADSHLFAFDCRWGRGRDLSHVQKIQWSLPAILK